MFQRSREEKSIPLKLFVLTALSTAAIALAGCVGGPRLLPASECPLPELGVSEYIIGAGDSLQINVWRSPELSTTVLVRPDGRVTTPLVDDMQASGKSTSALAADIESVLSEYLRSPEVSVIISTQGSANQIQVVGEVNQPISVPYRDGLKLLDIMVAVGGLTDFAAGNRSKVVRTIDDISYECRVRAKDVLTGRLAENINMYGGDVLVVPETRF